MITNKTYNEILTYLRLFATEHMDVFRFESEDEDQMSALTSIEELFPMIFVAPINNLYDYEENEYSMRIYCYDRLTKDRKNIDNARSRTNQILSDLDVWLRKESTLPFETTVISSVYPFSSELMTDVTGWYIDITINVPSYSVCDIPFFNKPVVPLNPCSGTVDINPYLRCTDLKDCPTIIDMKLRIDDNESNAIKAYEMAREIYQGMYIKRNDFFIAINFEEIEDFSYVVPEPFKIDSIDNPDGISFIIAVNGSPYTLGDTISMYDTLEIRPDSVGFIKLNNTKL